MSKIIGIDLGTSTSEVVFFADGKPIMIPNEAGEEITPSVIGLDEDGQFLVGKKAEERYLLYPEKTVIEVKRKMGSGEKIFLDDREFTPAELSSKILAYLKKSAEIYLQEEVDRAVITVPAYFNNQQRQETMEAGKLAGLKVERIINEPTAAALNYGLEHLEEESYILVYDFGGGTFDVTLLEMFDGVLEVKASNGDNQLGGKDFDQAIIDYLLQCCEEEYHVDLRNDLYAMVRLKDEAIRCKIALSKESSYEILLPMLSQKGGKPISIQKNITVELFEELIGDLVERTRKPVQMVLSDGKIQASQLDKILLVGGSTKVPLIKRYVEKLIGKKPEELVNPDLAVVLGAGIQGAMLENLIDAEHGIFLTDVAPYPLGVRVAVREGFFMDTDVMDVLIPRNITIPVTKRKRYTTCEDGQTVTDIEIYQGEKKRATANYFLGKFVLSGIPSRRAGVEVVDVEFSYDLNGVLDVKAIVVSNGCEAKITIETAGIKEESADTTEWKKAPKAKAFRSTLHKAEKLEQSGEIQEEEEQEALSELIEKLKLALIHDVKQEELEELEGDLLVFMEYYLD